MVQKGEATKLVNPFLKNKLINWHVFFPSNAENFNVINKHV